MDDENKTVFSNLALIVRKNFAGSVKGELTEGTEFGRDLALDSLQLLELIAEIEDSYSISVPLEQLGSIRTLGDAACLVKTMKEKK